MPEEVETPEAPAVAETPATPVVAETPPIVPSAEATADLTQQLSVKDAEIATLRGQIKDAATDQTAKERLSLNLADTVTARNKLKDDLDAAIASRSSAIDTMTQATQSLVERQSELERQLAEYDTKLETERASAATDLSAANAKIVRYEVVLKEFPQLLPFVDRILASEDLAAVRADATAFNTARSTDLQALQRQAAGTVLSTTPGASPLTPTPAVTTSSEDLRQRMRDATNANDPAAFEKARREYLEAYEAGRGAVRA